jgi:hypothetical protein
MAFYPKAHPGQKLTPDRVRLPLLEEVQDAFLHVLLSLSRPCMFHPIPRGVLRQWKFYHGFPGWTLLIQMRQVSIPKVKHLLEVL